jgi:large subunit ribosomal protein L23
MRSEDALKVVIRPYITEKTFELIEKDNKLVFLISMNSNKNIIRQAIETLYDVKVKSVNIMNGLCGKKAYVRLSPESSATDLAAKLGLV